MAKAVYFDIEAEQHSTYNKNFEWKDKDGAIILLAGGTAKIEIKDKIDGSVKQTLTQAAEITLADTSPNLNIKFAPTYYGEYVYDLILTPPGGDITRLMEGKVIVDRAVTTP